MMLVLAETSHMRLLTFAVFLATVGPASAANSVPDCGTPGSRWLADVYPQGGGGGEKLVLPIDDRLDLEVKEEIGFAIIVRDRNTGKNVFGTPPHGAEPYYLSPPEVRLRRAGVVLSTADNGNITSLEAGPDGGVLIVDARDLYSNREDPDDMPKDELFSKGSLRLCWK
jgi:hypothetical protein